MIVDPVAILRDTYRFVLPSKFDSYDANRFVLTAGLQESGFLDHYQKGRGPARGLWQFERVGVKGVLTHDASARFVKAACAIREIKPTVDACHAALVYDDIFACALARLLLWTDPRPLPTTAEASWDCYLRRTWRPGKPHPATWPKFYQQAAAMLAEE